MIGLQANFFLTHESEMECNTERRDVMVIRDFL